MSRAVGPTMNVKQPNICGNLEDCSSAYLFYPKRREVHLLFWSIFLSHLLTLLAAAHLRWIRNRRVLSFNILLWWWYPLGRVSEYALGFSRVMLFHLFTWKSHGWRLALRETHRNLINLFGKDMPPDDKNRSTSRKNFDVLKEKEEQSQQLHNLQEPARNRHARIIISLLLLVLQLLFACVVFIHGYISWATARSRQGRNINTLVDNSIKAMGVSNILVAIVIILILFRCPILSEVTSVSLDTETDYNPESRTTIDMHAWDIRRTDGLKAEVYQSLCRWALFTVLFTRAFGMDKSAASSFVEQRAWFCVPSLLAIILALPLRLESVQNSVFGEPSSNARRPNRQGPSWRRAGRMMFVLMLLVCLSIATLLYFLSPMLLVWATYGRHASTLGQMVALQAVPLEADHPLLCWTSLIEEEVSKTYQFIAWKVIWPLDVWWHVQILYKARFEAVALCDKYLDQDFCGWLFMV